MGTVEPARMARPPLKGVLAAVAGLVLAGLAISSVWLTAQANHKQSKLVQCGARIISDNVKALTARDQAQVELNGATDVIVVARQQAYHALYDEIRHVAASADILDNAITVYDHAVAVYLRAVADDDKAIHQAPIPSNTCLAESTR